MKKPPPAQQHFSSGAKNAVANLQKKMFGNVVSGAGILGLAGDSTLMAICDWQLFEEKVVKDPKFRLPS